MKLKLTIVLLSLIVSVSCYAQFGRLFSADNELSNSLINQVYQDSKGIIWIATRDGLNRYDGAKFKIYRHVKSDPHSLLYNSVEAIFEDNKGHLLIGFFKGLQVYDRATDSFREIALTLEDGHSFQAHVLSIVQRKNGELLVGTSGKGIFSLSFDGEKTITRRLSHSIYSDWIICMHEDSHQRLWISSEDQGLYFIDENKKKKIFLNGNKKPFNGISSLCEDRQGNLYIGSMYRGFRKYDQATQSFLAIPYGNSLLSVKTLYLNNQGKIYIGTEGDGMKVYDPQTQKITDHLLEARPFELSKAKVYSVIEDQAGNIWMGIFQKGVLLEPVRPNKFKYIGYKSTFKSPIGSNCVMSICKDHEGDIWVGMDHDGIYCIGSDEKQKAHYLLAHRTNAIPATVMSIFEDSKNNVWMGLYLDGIVRWNRKTGRCENMNHVLGKSIDDALRIYSITEDQNQNLWIGTMGNGLFCLNLNTMKSVSYNADSHHATMLHNNWISCLQRTSDGKQLYIGTCDGIGCLDLKTRSFVSTYKTNRLLANNAVYTMYEDMHGNLWIGTDEGLIRLDHATHQFNYFTSKDGLPNDIICAIEGDKANNLWISTSHGLSRMDLKDNTFVNYYSNDGLQGNEFSQGASFMDREGQLLFGGLNGITYFDPAEISDVDKKLQVHLTDFYINNQPVRKGMKSGFYDIVKTSVMDAKKIHLSYKDNSFSMEFSTMEFYNPERMTYLYSINEEKWISLSPGTNRVFFSNLSPGTYHLKVRAKDYNTYSEIKEIDIVISPAWYLSIWAEIMYLLLAIGAVFSILQQRRNQAKAQRRLQEHIHAEQINEAKLQFFTNISHEIRTPMTLIVSPLEKLMSSDKDSNRQQIYALIYRNSLRILHLINQLMDIRKIDNGRMVLHFREVDIVDSINNLYSLFEYQAHDKHIQFFFNHELEKLNVWIDLNNFDKVLMNILSNAFKFTAENGFVVITLNVGEDDATTKECRHYFEITITDNGVGMEDHELERIFDRFYQINTPLNSSHAGTGVGLHLTRSLVELHHGTIRVKNNENGEGCSFVIRMPLGKDHLKAEELGEDGVAPNRSNVTVPVPSEEAANERVLSKSKYHVLVVEDDDEIRKYICSALSSEYHVVESANGKDALAMIMKKTPDLIISDVMMPEMDGITLCQKVKQNININFIPVVLLTAKASEEDLLEGLNIGADAYMVKPFSIDILIETIRNLIKNRELLRNNFNGNQEQKSKIQKITIKSADEKLLEKIMAVVNKNLSNPDLNVAIMADQVGLSRVHLYRKLKELTNQSPSNFVRNIRLKQAITLLAGKHLTISEVADVTGFKSLASFSTMFKQFYGVSPREFMNEHQSTKELF